MKKLAMLMLVLCVALPAVSSAGLLREIWDGGRNIDEAIALAKSGTPADQVEVLDAPEEWVDIADNYSARLSGWLTVPATGEYTFYVAGDDNQRMYVSQDDNPGNGALVAYVDGWTSHLEWTKYESQKAAPMMLTEGQVLAFVGIMQEGGGGDSMTFGWTGPGIDEVTFIPGENFVHEYEVTTPSKATNPSPADGAIDLIDVVATWDAPEGAEAPVYNVYGGTDPAALDLLAEGLTEASLAVGTAGVDLDVSTTYYWRVDTDGAEGFVWSFTTEAETFVVADVVASSSAASDPSGGEPQATADGSGLENGEHGTDATTMWLGVPAEGEAVSIQYELPRVLKLAEMTVWNHNTDFEGIIGYGFKDTTVEYSADGETWTVLTDIEIPKAPGAATYTGMTVDLAGVAAQYVKLTANTNWGGLFPNSGLAEVQITYTPAQARLVAPADGATGAALDTVLDWYAGRGAVAQDLSINGENVASPEDSIYAPELVYGMPYAWQVDTSDGTDLYAGDIWGFTTTEFDALGDGGSLMYLGADATAELMLDPAADLTVGAADTLQVSFSGAASVPYIYEPNEADGSVVMDAAGADIWGSSDEFHFAFQSLTGDADIIARVDSLEGTHSWAKAGVMIRQDLTGGSTNAATLVTGGSGGGGTFQYRTEANSGAGGQRTLEGVVDITPGFYVRLVREGNTFTGYFSEDGVEWLLEGTQEVEMVDPVYVGLAITSHDTGSIATAKWSEIAMTGDITGDPVNFPIALSNDPAGLAITVEDGAGVAATVVHPDPNATNLTGQNWQISLQGLADAGVDLASIAKITVGTVDATGAGVVSVGSISAGTPLSHNVVGDVTGPDDTIVGIPNDGDWPGGETPNLCIDNNDLTKYLHFKGETEPSGIQVTPAVGASVVTGLTLTSANDAPPRDPGSFELSGSNDGVTYEVIAAGDVVDFIGEAEWPRFTLNATEITFENTVAYTHYQLMFPTVRDAGNANSMQIAEIELLGVSSW